MNEIIIREADKIEICILVDNYSDMFLPDMDKTGAQHNSRIHPSRLFTSKNVSG